MSHHPSHHLRREDLWKLCVHAVRHGGLSLLAVRALEAHLDVLEEGEWDPPAEFFIGHAEIDEAAFRDIVEQISKSGLVSGKGRKMVQNKQKNGWKVTLFGSICARFDSKVILVDVEKEIKTIQKQSKMIQNNTKITHLYTKYL